MARAALGGVIGSRSLTVVRVSRCVRDRIEAGCRAVVLGVQRRACHLGVDDGPLLIMSTAEVSLAPNAVAVDVASRVPPNSTLTDAGFRVGQTVALGASAAPHGDSEWLVTLGTASTWEPRPRIHRVAPRDLVDRLRATHAAVVADGAGESLLPLLWASESGAGGLWPELIRVARVPARLLSDAVIRGDEGSMVRAARGLAGLGPGLTPSGDDLLAGFTAASMLVGESVGLDRVIRIRVTTALFAGAERGASPLGRVWLAHALEGELLEPMTRFVAALLAADTCALGPAVRAALAVGSSSGTDWMVGFLLGARAVLDATTRGLPW